MEQNAASHQQTKFSILQDIYGHRTGGFYEFGLADAFNKEDFGVKLASLQEKWNSLCPEFFGWFKKQSDFFVENVIQSAREGSDVCGLYYQNAVELKRWVKILRKKVKEAVGNTQKLSDRQYSEEVRAIYRAGSYVLSFFLAGRKANCAKRIRTSPNPDIVMDRLEVSARINNSSSRPIVIAETSQVVKESASQPNVIAESGLVQHNIRFQDPRASPPKEFVLFLRKHLPQNITKCQGRCGKSISNEDEMIICSYGTSTWTNKVTGRGNSKYGPMNLHFNEKCLKNFGDENYYGPG